MLSDLSMSDFRLSHEEGTVEKKEEDEVRVEECTLRGGQESYRRHISIIAVARRRGKLISLCRCSSRSSCVACFKTGWVGRQTADGEQAGCKIGNGAEQSKGD